MGKIKMAYSKRNGIGYYSKRHPGMAVETCVEENGEIKSKIIPRGMFDIMEFFGFFIKDSNNVSIMLDKKIVYGIDIALILISFLTLNFSWTIALIYFTLTVSVDFFAFIILVQKLKFGEYKSVAMFHGAEHKAVNAYIKLGRVPTAKEIRQYSRFSKNCNFEPIIRRLIVYTGLTIVIGISPELNVMLYIILIVILVLTLFLDQEFGFLRFLQFMVTSKPTDLEIQVAIKGLEELEKFENDESNLVFTDNL